MTTDLKFSHEKSGTEKESKTIKNGDRWNDNNRTLTTKKRAACG